MPWSSGPYVENGRRVFARVVAPTGVGNELGVQGSPNSSPVPLEVRTLPRILLARALDPSTSRAWVVSAAPMASRGLVLLAKTAAKKNRCDWKNHYNFYKWYLFVILDVWSLLVFMLWLAEDLESGFMCVDWAVACAKREMWVAVLCSKSKYFHVLSLEFVDRIELNWPKKTDLEFIFCCPLDCLNNNFSIFFGFFQDWSCGFWLKFEFWDEWDCEISFLQRNFYKKFCESYVVKDLF